MKVLTISSSEKVGSIFKIVVLGKAKIEFAANVEVKDGKAEKSILQFWIILIQTTFLWKSFLGWEQMAP